jgi:hypothetical protein
MSLGRYKTAGEILERVGIEAGIGSIVNPFASSNTVWRRLVAYLASIGARLAAEYPWPNLIQDAVFIKATGVWTVVPTGWSQVAALDEFYVPADFDSIVRDVNWDVDGQTPLGDSLNHAQYVYRTVLIGMTVWVEYRQDTNKVWFMPVPFPDTTIRLSYNSRAWVRPAAAGLGNGQSLGPTGWDTPEAVGDWVLFPPTVIEAALLLEWKKKTGQNTAQAQKDFDDIISVFVSKTPARVLSLDGRGPRRPINVPDTGYGS